jgi:DNA-binding NarL/FixJ family response regulator
MTAVVRVAIVDDHPVFRLGLAAAIAEMNGIDLVGEATTCAEVPKLVATTAPDVILLDVGLPDGSGSDLVGWIATEHPTVRVLMLTMSDDPSTALGHLRDGARGFLVKGADADRVENALRAVAAGDVVVDGALVAELLAFVPARTSPGSRPFPSLTDREFEVLGLLAEGLDNGEIARRLYVNPKTARNHVSNVFTKLGVTSRAGAIVEAHRHGIGA